MKSLVFELQTAAEDEKIKISALLRKAKVVAAKLKRTDINEWIQKEIHGYTAGDPIPRHRKLSAKIELWSNTTGEWEPINYNNVNLEQKSWDMDMMFSMIEIEAILEDTRKDTSNTQITFKMLPSVLEQMNRDNIFSYFVGDPPCWRIQRGKILSMLEKVRDKILDWSLELEGQGITGKGMTFSKEEIDNATAVTLNINNSNVTGIGDINASIIKTDDHSTSTTIEAGDHSTILSNVDIKDYSQIYLELKEKGVPDDAVKELKEAIDLLQKGNAKDKESALKKGMAFLEKYGTKIGALAIIIKSIFAG